MRSVINDISYICVDAITYPCPKIKRRIRQPVNKVCIREAYINSDQRTARNIPVVGVSDSKVHGANMGPTWVLSAPDGPHVGPMNLAIRGYLPCNRVNQILRTLNNDALVGVSNAI